MVGMQQAADTVDRVIDIANGPGLESVTGTVTGAPASACRMNVGIARPSRARVRGPKVLKIRTILVSTRCVVR